MCFFDLQLIDARFVNFPLLPTPSHNVRTLPHRKMSVLYTVVLICFVNCKTNAEVLTESFVVRLKDLEKVIHDQKKVIKNQTQVIENLKNIIEEASLKNIVNEQKEVIENLTSAFEQQNNLAQELTRRIVKEETGTFPFNSSSMGVKRVNNSEKGTPASTQILVTLE